MWRRSLLTGLLLALALALPASATSNIFTVAVYNLENWLTMERSGGTNSPKPLASREAAVNVIAGIRPDVLGVVELGTAEDLAELQTRLREQGLAFPHTEWIQGADPTRHVAVLSRFPITERYSRTNDTYRLSDRDHRVQRGILDVRIQPTPEYSFRAVVVHLKSRRESEEGDQVQMRLAEAKLLRHHLETILAGNPNENFIAMGDFNDAPTNLPVRVIAGTNSPHLFVLHPRDNRGYDTTHFWRGKREWSRLDYLMLSPGMSNEFLTGSAHIAAPTNALTASDHRAVYASFNATDTGAVLLPMPPVAAPPPARPHPSTLPNLYILLATVIAIAVIVFVYRKRAE